MASSSGKVKRRPRGRSVALPPGTEVVVCPASRCLARDCSGKLYVNRWAATEAKVLDVDGWKTVKLVPVRCWRSGCSIKNKMVYYNYVAMSKKEHVWCWPYNQTMKYFFVANDWGVSVRWLQQMSRRLVYHFASFRGEAKVHEAEAKVQGQTHLVPDKAHLKLLHAWLLWRLVLTLVDM